MNRILLAIAVIAACSAPALAGSTHAQGKAKPPHAATTFERPWKSERAKKKTDQDEAKDPYWEPCDYSTNWGPNACGGS
jgi:hypothetical protein